MMPHHADQEGKKIGTQQNRRAIVNLSMAANSNSRLVRKDYLVSHDATCLSL